MNPGAPSRAERVLPVAILGVVVLFNALVLLPEVTMPVANVNDDAEHALFVRRAVEAFRGGEDPIDLWVPQVELGFPQLLLYQHGAHVAVALLDVLLPGYIDPRTLFDLVRWLLMVAFPLTVFWSLRRMGIAPMGAAVAGAFAGLLSGSHRYGFEYDSYVWRGLGLFTQLAGMHLVFVALALLHGVLTRGRGMFAAALACAALVLTHLIYAYMLALTVVPLFVATASRARLRENALRLTAVGTIALVLSSYMWLPFLKESAFLDVSPYLGREKYDSFGAPTILGWLVGGDLFDHGRVPVFTALVALGIAAAIATRTRLALVALAGFALWLLLYFGRPTLGHIADLLPMSHGLLFHRFVGGVDLFAIVLVGIGAAWGWQHGVRLLSRSRPLAIRLVPVAALVLAVLFAPAVLERAAYYGDNTAWLAQTRHAIAADGDAQAVLAVLRTLPPGRAYAGLRSNWGATLDFGIPFNSVRFYNLFADEGRDAVAPPYRGASLNSDLLFDFDDQDLADYALFNVDYVVAPPAVRLPSTLVPLMRTRTLVLYAAPGGGYVEYVGVTSRTAAATQTALFPLMRGWLASDAAARRDFVRLDFPAAAAPADGWTPTARCPGDGSVSSEDVRPARIDAVVECPSASSLVFKITYHPGWVVTVDGRRVTTYMVSPSLLAIDVPAGRHMVSAEYRSDPLKAPLLALGGLALAAMAGATLWPRRRRLLTRSAWRDVLPDPRLLIEAHPVAAWRIAAIAVSTVVVLALRAVTPQIAFNDGLGNDGRLYASMVHAFREHFDPQLVPPWAYRWGPSLLVALSGSEVRTGFLVLNAACVIASGLLLFEVLRHHGVRAPLALVAVAWLAMLPAGARFGLYYPVLTDSAGFLLLMVLLWSALKERYAIFAVALVAAAVTRENLLAVGPFLWLLHVRRAPVRVTALSLAAGVPGLAAYFLIRAFPVFAPPPDFGNWLDRYQVGLNIRWVTENIDDHAWRFILAAPLTLGVLFVLPFAHIRAAAGFLRANPAWVYYLVSTVVLVFIGGRDDDRYFLALAPALAVLSFVPGTMSMTPITMLLLTLVHTIATRSATPLGTSEADYFAFSVAYMRPPQLWQLTWVTALCAVATLLLVRGPRGRRRSFLSILDLRRR